MATIKQIDANRRNAELSTGPVTPEGKERAAANALKSGIYAESEVIFTERREDLETLKTEYHVRFQPPTPEARDMVDSVIRSAWLLRRFAAAEASLFNRPFDPGASENQDQLIAASLNNSFKRLDLLQRRINATERNFHRSLKALQTLEAPPELASFPQKVLSEPLRPPSAVSALKTEPDPRPEPEQSKPTSEKLASFPQNSKTPSGEAAPPPESRIPTPCSAVPRPDLPDQGGAA